MGITISLTRALTLVNGLPQKKVQIYSWFIPSTGWFAFPSYTFPSLFNIGHVHYYVLESIPLNLYNTEDIEDALGHMTGRPMKNRRKYVDSGFVHDMMGIIFMFPSPEYLMNLLCLLCIEIIVLAVYRISTTVLQEYYFVANIFVT